MESRIGLQAPREWGEAGGKVRMIVEALYSRQIRTLRIFMMFVNCVKICTVKIEERCHVVGKERGKVPEA